MGSVRQAGPYRGTVAIDTHGCKLNQADSESLAREFIESGYRIVDSKDGPDIYVLNTCSVTHVADSKARRALRAARRKNPVTKIVATGCYAQRDPQGLAKVNGINLMINNLQKPDLVTLTMQIPATSTTLVTAALEPRSSQETTRRTRAMIKIQEGCNQVCAYCIVPKLRGREQSIPPELLLKQVRSRVKEGYKEVVLTGTQLGSYGFDLSETNLKSLLELLLKSSSIERLRVSSLQPQEITHGLLQLWEDSRLCPHFHMPLQSGSSEVLGRMRRRYTADLYGSTVEKILAFLPHAAITTDIIVGFPSEGEEDFEQSLRLCERLNLAGMHVFPYSVRPGTSAAYMVPQVSPEAKRARMEQMLSLAKRKAHHFRQQSLTNVRPVLWETKDPANAGTYFGLTDNYLKVMTRSSKVLTNLITPARLIKENEGIIYSELV